MLQEYLKVLWRAEVNFLFGHIQYHPGHLDQTFLMKFKNQLTKYFWEASMKTSSILGLTVFKKNRLDM